MNKLFSVICFLSMLFPLSGNAQDPPRISSLTIPYMGGEQRAPNYYKTQNGVVYFHSPGGPMSSISPTKVAVRDADPATFRNLRKKHKGKNYGDNYCKDNNRAYYFRGYYFAPIQQSDGATFKVFDQYFSGDRSRVYYEGNAIKGADRATFEVLTENLSYDKNSFYNREYTSSEIDRESFQNIGFGFYKDYRFLYFIEKDKQIVKIGLDRTRLDYSTLKASDTKSLRDKNGSYTLDALQKK